MDLIDEGSESNTPEFSVSELSGAVKRVIEGEFGFCTGTRGGWPGIAPPLRACLSGSQR